MKRILSAIGLLAALCVTAQAQVMPGSRSRPPAAWTGCVYNSTQPSLLTGSGSQLQCDVHGSLYGLIRDGAGNNRSAYVNSSNQLSVSLDGGTGATVAATQSGSWTVAATQSGTWNITNISGTISLPTGAATAAKQPALGTAGTASSDVLTVQGIASMTPLLVNPGTAANWGVGATGSAVPANAMYAGVSDGTNLRGWLGAANALNSTGNGLGTAQIIGQFDDTSPTTITENQFGNVRMSANRNLYGTIRDAAGNERGANVSAGNALLVDASATTQPISGSVSVSGTVTVSATNLSTNIAQLAGTTTAVNNGTASAGTLRVAIASDNTANSNPWLVSGAAASGATVAGNPLLGGGKAINAEVTAVTNGQAIANSLDLVGRQIVFPYANKENLVKGTATTTGTSDTSLVAAQGANVKFYLTQFSCYNSGSTTATITFKDGSGGSTLWVSIAPSGGGTNQTLPAPVATTANTALYFAAGSSSTTVGCAAGGFKGS